MRYTYDYFDGFTKNGEPTKVVKCTSHFAGKPVVAVAKCLPDNEYEVKTGEDISRARCDVRVADKRVKYAKSELKKAIKDRADADKNVDKAIEYLCEAEATFARAQEELKKYPVNH